MSAVPKRFRWWTKFAISSASAGRTTLCIENKNNTTRIKLVMFIFLYLIGLLVNMFAMWFMKLVLLHNSCGLIFSSMLDAAVRRVLLTCLEKKNAFNERREYWVTCYVKRCVNMWTVCAQPDGSMSSPLQSTGSSPYVLVHIVGPLAATVSCKHASEILFTTAR